MPVRARPGAGKNSDVLDKIREGKMKRQQQQEEAATVVPEGTAEGDPEWEDKVTTTFEYCMNFILALIVASLPASQTPPDYLVMVVVLVANLVLNLFMFSPCWMDRLSLYATNIVIVLGSDAINQADRLPGKMEPLQWAVFLSSNAALFALFWWHYVRRAEDSSDREWRWNVTLVAVMVVNTVVGLATGTITIYHVGRTLKTFWNVLVHQSLKQP